MLTKEQLTEVKLYAAQFSACPERLPQTICPSCRGGSSKERSFNLWYSPLGLHYFCHRTSCGERGVVAANGRNITMTGQARLFEPRKFEYATCSPTMFAANKFSEKYEITEQELIDNGVLCCPSRNSFIFPVYNLLGYEIGILERWYAWTGDAKRVLYYPQVDYPVMYMPRTCALSDTMVVVEDVLSAIKVSRIIPCCALLGTHLSRDVMLKFKEVGIKSLIFALDPDAAGKAIKLKKEVSLWFDEVSVVLLSQDPKDMPMSELQDILEEYKA